MADIGRVITNSSLSFKLALIALLITLLIHIIGFSTEHWTYLGNIGGSFKHGLWKFCICVKAFFREETCVCSMIEPGSSWNLDTVRALESIGLIGILMVILFSVVGVAQDNGQTWKTFSILTSFGSCLVILVGVVIYATTTAAGEYLHFSFVLCTVAGCAMFICGCLLVADKNTKPRPEGGTVLHYTNQNQSAVIQPAYQNQGQYVGQQYPANIQPPPYNQVQYYPGYIFTTAQGPSAPAQSTLAGQPPGYNDK